jgi:3-isopropylmalate dehydrogenase
LRYSFGLAEDAGLIDRAAQSVLAAGIRTGDIATPGITKVSTTTMGDAMLQALDGLAGA